jgi:tetratricopeptide (TPR) repeat protein
VISVLSCSSQALNAPGMGADAVSLYVKFCDLNSDAASDAAALTALEQSLRELIAKAPQFSYGHSQLALFTQQKAQIDPAHAAALQAESVSEAEKAISLDPKNPQGYTAKARNIAPPGWIEREKNLSLAASLPGTDPLPSAVYALMLAEVGRLNDAAVQAHKLASEDTTGDPDYVILIATSLASQGKDDDADRALTRALQIAPNNPVIQNFRFHMYEWFGRWDEALSILNDDTARPDSLAQEDDLAATRAFIAAVESQLPGDRSAAREAELASVSHDRSHLMAAVSHLSSLGLVDDAYSLMDRVPPSAQSDDLSVLFTPLNGALRRDPRFIALAGKLGLVSYWSHSGKWPDFCGAPDLHYNCRVEAQKLAAR